MKRKSVSLALMLAVALSAGAPAAQESAENASAKNIFYEPERAPTPPPAAEQQVAVKFWVELHPRGGAAAQTVTADHTFYSNDRTKYRVSTNVDCYVYVAYQGSMGDRALLFPALDAGMNNQVKRYSAKVLPTSGGFFTFDEHPGKEHLVIVASPSRIPELDAIASKRQQGKSIMLSAEENDAFAKFLADHTGDASGGSSKNIVYEAESSGSQTGSYYAQRTPGFAKPVIINISLDHQ